MPASDYAHLIHIGRYTEEERIQVRRRRVRIGRDARLNDVCIAQETISSQHAAIEYRDGSFFLRDLHSANGTFLIGKQIGNRDSLHEAHCSVKTEGNGY